MQLQFTCNNKTKKLFQIIYHIYVSINELWILEEQKKI